MTIAPGHTDGGDWDGRSTAQEGILVVDDSPGNLQAVTSALADTASDMVTAMSGREALRQLLRRDFAVVLLDVSMPAMDGYETARLIRSRERNRRVPIIFVTAYDRDQSDVLRAYELGAVDFLFKPIQPEVLRAKVGVFVELQRRTAELARQGARLRQLERREHQQELAAQRRELEAISVSRQMEEQRRTAQRLAEMDRRKDHFLAMLGHELRTPLAAMVVGTELASRRETSPEVRARAEAALARQLQHLVRLVDDLLDVTRIGSGRIELRRQSTTLDDIIDRALELARPAIDRAGHTLTVHRNRDSVCLDVDPARIVQALSNLLHNAARYTEPGGHITLSACLGDDFVEIAVEDDGRGIAADKIDAVFDIFVRQGRDHEGLGLGLPLARTLVELHGGSLVAHSAGLGAGARFVIRLPSAREQTPGLHPSASPADRRQETGDVHRVLVIEDSDDLRATMHDLLTSWGYRVEVAATGESGLRMLLEHEPDLALIDIGLPDLDGCEVARRAVASGRCSTRMVALTGFTQAGDHRRISAAGFECLFPKPPDLERLRQVLGAPPERHG